MRIQINTPTYVLYNGNRYWVAGIDGDDILLKADEWGSASEVWLDKDSPEWQDCIVLSESTIEAEVDMQINLPLTA